VYELGFKVARKATLRRLEKKQCAAAGMRFERYGVLQVVLLLLFLTAENNIITSSSSR
jgi:hypothetical protein